MDAAGVIKALMSSGQFSLTGVLLVLIFFGGKFFWKEYKGLQKEHKKDIEGSKEEYKDIVKQMFEVVNKNTESNTKLSEAVRDMSQTVSINNRNQ